MDSDDTTIDQVIRTLFRGHVEKTSLISVNDKQAALIDDKKVTGRRM